MVNYLEIAKKAYRGDQEGETSAAHPRKISEEASEKRRRGVRTPTRDKSDRSGQSARALRRVRTLTIDEILEELACLQSGPGMQARLYREGRITRENAIKWIACAVIYRLEGKEASFNGWRRHEKAVEIALNRLCTGRVYADSAR